MNTNQISGKALTKAQTQPTDKPRFHTQSATIIGALCGHIWMPQAKATLSITEDLHARFNRFSNKAGATFRDALLSTLNENGGDFQSPSFTADTMLVIKRARVLSPTRYETRIREIAISELPDCDDLVDADCYSYDFNNED